MRCGWTLSSVDPWGAEGYKEATDGVQAPAGPLPDPPGVRGRTPSFGVYALYTFYLWFLLGKYDAPNCSN